MKAVVLVLLLGLLGTYKCVYGGYILYPRTPTGRSTYHLG